MHGEFLQQAKVHLRGSGCKICGANKRSEKKRLPIEEVLKRFHEKHGDRYSYEKMKYRSAMEKIIIICPDHGEFNQTPQEHFLGTGCKGCQDRTWTDKVRERHNLTTNDFVARANEIHNNYYDYSRVSFDKFSDEVLIICSQHGEFIQRPKTHLSGSGCPKCAYEKNSIARSLTFTEFAQRASKIHGQYQYSKQTWTSSSDKTEIVCPEHGPFLQRPHAHLQGRGCPACGQAKRGLSRKSSQDQIVKVFLRVHGKKYDYSRFNYISQHFKSTIICPKHGEFLQSASNHRAGKGCPLCKNDLISDALRKSTLEVIRDFRKIHGDMYDYSLIDGEYQNANEPITIICRKHGEFSQIPYNHLMGKGCPKCRESTGEKKIRRILEERGIRYIYEWKDHNCIAKRALKFDFYIPSHNAIIEYDGEQHFDPHARWWSSDKEANLRNYTALRERDQMKTEWALENGYELLRIRFDEKLETVLLDFLEGLNC